MRRIPLASLSVVLAALGLALPLTSCGSSGGGSFGSDALVTLTTTSIPPAVTGQEDYTVTFQADFPHGPGTFALAGGALPPGMKLNSFTGELTGVPRLTGTYHFTIAAEDGIDPLYPNSGDQTFAQDSKTFTLPVSVGPPNLLEQVLPAGVYHQSYSYQLDASGGTPPYTFTDVSVFPDGLPNGLSIGPTGIIGSLPNASNGVTPYQFRARVTDSLGAYDEQDLQIVVVVPLLIIFTPSPLPAGAAAVPYNRQLTLASAGAGAPIVWSQVAPGPGETLLDNIDMELTQDGILRNKVGFPGPRVGNPSTAPYTVTFTIKVTDGLVPVGQVDQRTYSLTVNPGPVLFGISPNRASAAGPFVASGLNFQTGATLEFKPGLGSTIITPTVGANGTTLTFNNAPPVPVGGTGSVSVRVLNPDGGNFTLPNAFTFPAANISFNTKAYLASPLSSTGVDCADVNGDGKADVIHCGCGVTAYTYFTYSGGSQSTAGGLNLHMNTGGMNFTTVSLSGASFFGCKFVDLNFDNKPDIVALGLTQVFTWINTGVSGTSGNFVAGPVTTMSPSPAPGWPSDLQVGKLDSDAFVDLSFGSGNYPVARTTGAIYTMKGTGGGNFSPLDSNTASMPTTYGVVTQVMVDSNNDGRMEIAAGIGCNGGSTGPVFNYSDTSANGLFTGWGTRGTVPTGQPYYGSTTAMAVGDFLGVGTQSLVTLHSGSPGYSNYQVYQLHSGSQLNSVTTFTTPALVGKAACAIDADFDAKIDWAISYKDSLIRVYRGSTQGQVAALDAAAGSPSISSPKTGFMAPGDVDGDGKPDIVCTTSYFAIEGMASIYGSTYSHQTPGNGSSMGIVFFLNTSN